MKFLYVFLMLFCVNLVSFAGTKVTKETLSSLSGDVAYTNDAIWLDNNAPPVSDASSSNEYDLHIKSGNVYVDNLDFNNKITITVYSGATFTITGNLAVNNHFTFDVQTGAKLIIGGDFTMNNQVLGTIDGRVEVQGDMSVNQSNDISGSGSLVVYGEITDNGGVIDANLLIRVLYSTGNGSATWWSVSSTWSTDRVGTACNCVPTSDDVVVIQGGDYVAYVDAEALVVTVESNGRLEGTSTLSVGEEFIVENAALHVSSGTTVSSPSIKNSGVFTTSANVIANTLFSNYGTLTINPLGQFNVSEMTNSSTVINNGIINATTFTNTSGSLGNNNSMNIGTFDIDGGIIDNNSGAQIEITTELLVDGTLNLAQSSALVTTGTINSASSGTTTMQQLITGGSYHYISSPVLGAGSSAIGSPDRFKEYNPINANELFDGNTGWQYASSAFEPGIGYAIKHSGDYTANFSGNIPNNGVNNDGEIKVSVVHGTLDHPYARSMLVGNPYPCGLDGAAFLDYNYNTNPDGPVLATGTIYFWDEQAGDTEYTTEDYATMNMAGTVTPAPTGNGTTITDGIIHSCQGVMIETKTGSAGGNIVFNNSMKSSTNTGNFYKKSRYIERLRLNITYDKLEYNEILIAFAADATDVHDELYDSKKLFGSSKIALYSLLEETEYAIQSFPLLENMAESKKVRIGYLAGKSGIYKISASEFSNLESVGQIYLEDRLLNKFIDLRQGRSYEFKTNKGKYSDRFNIWFVKREGDDDVRSKILTSIDTSLTMNGRDVVIYSYKSDVLIKMAQTLDDYKAEVSIYNLSGQLVKELKIRDSLTKVSLNREPHGFYIVKHSSRSGVISKRVFVNH